MSVATSSLAAVRSAGRTLDRLAERPRQVLGVLIVAQIAATLALALSATHNGWVFFQGGDQIVNTTTGWLLGQFQLPPTEVGYIWPYVQIPITWVTGPSFVQALPPIVVLDVLVLGPIALLCVYGIASFIGGRLTGYWAATLWVIAPFAAIPLFDQRYHEKWIDQFLPQALGLTAMPDYPSMVVALAAALFVVRSLSPDRRISDAVLAGLLAGVAGGLKPPNYLFVIGAVLAYLAARRWREGAAFAIMIVPSILVLALWKERGLGYIPALTLQHVQLAAGSSSLPSTDVNLDRYIDLDFAHWRQQMGELREFFWSARLAQWAPFAGLIAVIRVQRGAIAALLGGWLAAFIVVKGFSPRASIETNTFWRLLMPAWPAYLLLFAAIPLLVPTLARRLGERIRPPKTIAIQWRWVGVAAIAAVVVPLGVIAASDPVTPPTPAIIQPTESGANILTPVDDSIETQVERTGTSVRVSWTPSSWRAAIFYRVYRSDGPGDDTQCVQSESYSWSCYLLSPSIATTRAPVFVDTSPPAAGATYRVGVATNWVDDPNQGDVFVLSPAAAVHR